CTVHECAYVVVVLYAFGEFFFFQAEDGIRDRNVTGVQTCALPILLYRNQQDRKAEHEGKIREYRTKEKVARKAAKQADDPMEQRSEERRVGKECRSRWAAEQEKKGKNDQRE